MLNVLNIGFEHAILFSIDDHQMWVVANDGGFVEPHLVDVLYITNGARYTVLVKLDRAGADYAMRFISTSTHQNLQGYSILRYPVCATFNAMRLQKELDSADTLCIQALRYPPHGAPMVINDPLSGTPPCVDPDGSIRPSCTLSPMASFAPYPRSTPPPSNRTLHFEIGTQPSKYEEHVTEVYLNKKPWQLYHAQMTPLLFKDNETLATAGDPVVGDLPWGTVVDLIVQNTLDDTMPLYKHGEPMYLLGSKANATWEGGDTVAEALRSGHGQDLNLKTPSRGLVHDVPPLGWAVLRWEIRVRGATMIHSNKFKYYAVSYILIRSAATVYA